MDESKNKLGHELKVRRVMADLTLTDVEETTGINKATVGQIENGKTADVKLFAHLVVLCSQYGYTVADVIEQARI